MSSEYPKADAYVIGAGPNGLAAAITLAQSGLDVVVLERNDTPGGGARTSELIRPGYRHDVCSAIHPTAYSSPYFMSLGLEKYGLEWIQPDIPCVHPLDDGDGVSLHRELGDTVRQLGEDGRKYKRLLEPFSKNWYALTRDILTPLGWPNNPLLMAQFGVRGLQPVSRFVKQFSTEKTKALVGGMAAHSILPFEEPGTTAFGLVLACSGHGVGWPFPKVEQIN
jgi:Phytoene dehydrogenase and related proteins